MSRTARAGVAAQRRYDEGLDRWRRKVLLPVIAITGPFVLAGLVIRIAAPQSWQFFGGISLGLGMTMAMWVWSSPPAYVENWLDGAEGERRTEKALRPLEAEGWVIVHDRAGPGGNRDHIAVGPGGVYLIDTKVRGGVVSIEGDKVKSSRLRDFDYRADVGSPLRRGAVELHEELGGWVQGVAAIWGDFPQRRAEHNRVAFVAGDELATWLRDRPQRLSQDRVARIAEQVRALDAA